MKNEINIFLLIFNDIEIAKIIKEVFVQLDKKIDVYWPTDYLHGYIKILSTLIMETCVF